MLYTIAIVALLVSLFLNNKKKVWSQITTLFRDLRYISIYLRALLRIWRFQKNQLTVAKLFTKLVQKHPKKIAMYFEDEVWTFQDVENLSNKIAHYFKKQGYQKGDKVALFLESRPEYVCVWLGLSKIGVITAFINHNLVGDVLVHSINAAEAKSVIFGSALKEAIGNISEKLQNMTFYQLNENTEKEETLPNALNLKVELYPQPVTSPTQDLENGKTNDKLMLIYTSGTTGLPKAAIITNKRFMSIACGMNVGPRIRQDDILYICLPLYHMSGGVLPMGQCLIYGNTIAIRKKFSASNFWKDCNKYKCTVASYIGEICRYLLACHGNAETPIVHPVRTFVGNGLRPQIWNEVVKKFGIKEIYEFYGSTEGNATIINLDSKPGAVGYIPKLGSFAFPLQMVKCDIETGEPIRGKNGFCELCKPGEPGLFLAKIIKKALIEFTGYLDQKATNKKLIRDVFKKGDLFFNTGDILVQDELGYCYFHDRIGDTFRLRGENVATTEVEAIISNILNLNDVIVYGVEVPKIEGRAGMAAIVDSNNSLDVENLAKKLKAHLPSYAIPVFIRITDSTSITGTWKLKKTELQREGFNVELIKDKLFLYDAKNVSYVELTPDRYNDILSEKIRL